MTPTDYCAQRAAEAGGDAALLARFAPAAARPAMLGLAALRADLEHLVVHRGDPTVARAKLAWWRQELAGLGIATAQHPATKALAASGSDHGALRAALVELLDAHDEELAGRSALPRAAWRTWLLRTGGGWAGALASLERAPAPEPSFGAALAAAEVLAALGPRLRGQRPAHPLEDGPGQDALAGDAAARAWVAAQAGAVARDLAPQALPPLLAIARALAARRAARLLAAPQRAWQGEPRHSLGALLCAWRAARAR